MSEQSSIRLWSKSRLTGRVCIMIEDATIEEIIRMLDGKRSRISSSLRKMAEDNRPEKQHVGFGEEE